VGVVQLGRRGGSLRVCLWAAGSVFRAGRIFAFSGGTLGDRIFPGAGWSVVACGQQSGVGWAAGAVPA